MEFDSTDNPGKPDDGEHERKRLYRRAVTRPGRVEEEVRVSEPEECPSPEEVHPEGEPKVAVGRERMEESRPINRVLLHHHPYAPRCLTSPDVHSSCGRNHGGEENPSGSLL